MGMTDDDDTVYCDVQMPLAHPQSSSVRSLTIFSDFVASLSSRRNWPAADLAS